MIDELLDRFDPDVPIESASMPPSAWYTDPAFFELERRALFSRSWQPLARVAELASSGAYSSGCFAGEPYVLVRDGERLRGFHNVCRHKGREVVTDSGVASELVCGYHGWRYRLDGRLASAPRTAGIRDFDRDAMSLPPLAVEPWGPWAWAGAADLAPLAPQLGELDRRLEATGWRELSFAGRQRWTLECNWKVYVDNYLDGGYHIDHAHPSLAAQIDTGAYVTEVFDGYSIQSAPPHPDPSEGGREPGRVENNSVQPARIGAGAIYAWIFPNFMINRYGPCLDTNWVVPLAPERCEVIYEFYFAGEASPDFIDSSRSEAAAIQREDIDLCESVQRGLRSSSYDTGRYAPRLEIAEHHFHRLLASKLRAAR